MKTYKTLAFPALLAALASPSLPAMDFWVTAEHEVVPVGSKTTLTVHTDVNNWPEAFFWRINSEDAGILTRTGPNQAEFLATSPVVPMPCRVEVITFPAIPNDPIRWIEIQVVAPNVEAAVPAGRAGHREP
jgi:hypothetical protein